MQAADRTKGSVRLYAALGAVFALFAGLDAAAAEYGFLTIPYLNRIPELNHRWLSLMVWPGIPLMAVVHWVLPQLKRREARVGGSVRLCYALLITGMTVESAGAVMGGRPPTAAMLVLAGAALQMAGAISYLLIVWRAVMRSLRPAVYDTLIQVGGLWFAGAALIHLMYATTLIVGIDAQFLDRAAICIDVAFLMGFVLNSLLGVVAAIMPHFLSTREPDTRALQSIVTLNIVLVAWTVAAGWSLQFPYTWVRLALSLFSLLAFGGLVYMLADLKAYDLIHRSITGTRQALARIAIAAMVICAVIAGVILAGIGIYIGGSDVMAIPNAETVTRLLLQVGVGGFGLMGLYVGLAGPPASRQWAVRVAYGTLGLLSLGLIGVIIPELADALSYILWYDTRLAYAVLAMGFWMLAAWLVGCVRR